MVINTKLSLTSGVFYHRMSYLGENDRCLPNYYSPEVWDMTRSEKPDIGSAEIISLWPSTAEIKSAEINSVNSVANSQKFIPAEITRYTVV